MCNGSSGGTTSPYGGAMSAMGGGAKHTMVKEGQDFGPGSPGYVPPNQPAPTPTGPGSNPNMASPTGGGFNIGGPPNTFYGTPYNQTYGGLGAPYADLGAQIRDSFNQYQQGAGRFGANAGARYGFGGAMPWRPDTGGFGGFNPFPYMGYSPFMRPSGPTPGTNAPAPGTPAPAAPSAAPSGGPDHFGNFQQLMGKDPKLAYDYYQMVSGNAKPGSGADHQGWMKHFQSLPHFNYDASKGQWGNKNFADWVGKAQQGGFRPMTEQEGALLQSMAKGDSSGLGGFAFNPMAAWK
jgi:hypothetical protein